ncbi:ribosomal protein L11 methyltransferase [Betaproteobacteria bacterium]|nr:ribosomal protein L11 methyltransferase [Betaproteobacteria bacterium]GHU42464.1 ribosomal protein L11 methyltransferase [Betaproteobacteria bacterium]
MAWISASLLADAHLAESLADALLDAGALSASIEDADAGTPAEKPQFAEPGEETASVWERSRVVALFAENAPVARIMQDAATSLGLAAPPDFALGRVEEENWVALTQAQFDPIRISSRLWIVPSWHEAPDPAALNLLLDPGMAFGTGSHPTTRLCLEWLERAHPSGKTLLDYGCGSGILAIAAARLGAAEVAGVDIDPQAITAARANAEKNGVTARFEVSTETLDQAYDLVIANILANPLRVLAPALCGHVRSGGSLALSGILEAQAAEIIALYAPWILLTVADTQEGWVCLAGVRP